MCYGHKMLSFAGVKLWSKLDPDLKSLDWLSFKKHLKRKLLQKMMIKSLHFFKSPDRMVPFSARSILMCCAFKSLFIVTEAVFCMREKTFGSIQYMFFVLFSSFSLFQFFISSLKIAHVCF